MSVFKAQEYLRMGSARQSESFRGSRGRGQVSDRKDRFGSRNVVDRERLEGNLSGFGIRVRG
jgi:hypothetical protein